MTQRSKMWDIPELVLLILDFLSRQDLVFVARVCRRLWEIATPLIWDSLTGTQHPTHLFNTFPQGLRESLMHGSIHRTDQLLTPYLDRTLWDRFLLHAPLVKSFDFVLSDWQDNLLPILQVLRLVGFAPIFPNLRTLNILISNPPHTAEVLTSLISPSLQAIHIDIREGLSALPDLAGILQMIESIHRLHLKELRFSCSHPYLSPSSQLAQGVARAIESQPQLLALDVLDIESRFRQPFIQASKLPNLQKVRLQRSSADDDPWDSIAYVERAIATPGFASLIDASIETLAEDMPIVLASITSTQLASLNLLVQGPNDEEDANPEPLSDLSRAFDELDRFSQLGSAQILFPASRLKWVDLKPLLSCHLLKQVVLEGYRLSLLVGDMEIEHMARAWPHLQVLSIQDTTRVEQRLAGRDNEETAPQVSLHGLSAFGIYCHQLTKLTISVDARCPPSGPAQNAIGLKMEDVRLPNSWLNTKVDSAGAVAAAIVQLWPNQILPPSPRALAWISERWAPSERHLSWLSEYYQPKTYGTWQRIWTEVYLNLSG